LRINLESEGYVVHLAEDGEEGLDLAGTIEPDLIVLDVMLPKRNGLEVPHHRRAEGLTMPIIILSAKAAEMDKVAGLELGAEDYVAKPFSLAELLARGGAVPRRSTGARPATPEKVRFGDVEVDLAARDVRRGGSPVEMTAR